MSNYTKGRTYEYKVMKELEGQNYKCIRSSGSHTPFDVIALYSNHIRFIQVKSEKQPTLNPVKAYKKDIEAIKDMVVPIFCTKELWVYTKNKGCNKYLIDHYSSRVPSYASNYYYIDCIISYMDKIPENRFLKTK